MVLYKFLYYFYYYYHYYYYYLLGSAEMKLG